ncbi:MAG: PAS domain S-box protein [Bacteroidetes bacterium]|nr:PAS domain S-box protein [Bacteroidota bacterium]
MNEVEKLKNKIRDLEKRLKSANKEENPLHQRSQELNYLVKNLPCFIFRCHNNKKWTMEYLSEEFEAITGYKVDQVVQSKELSIGDIIHEADRERVWIDIQSALKNKEKWQLNYKLVHSNGSLIRVCEFAEGIFTKQGKLKFIEGIIIDVTDRYESRNELNKSENKYREIFNNTFDAYFETGVDGVIQEVSPSIKNILGHSRGYMLGKNVNDFYVDKNRRKQLLLEILQKKTVENFELAAIHKNGNHVICLTSIHLLRDDHNKPLKLVGSLRDITQRRSIESENTKLLSAIEQSPVSVVITDVDGNIQYVNPKFTDITGYSRKEVIGQNPRFLKSGTHSDSLYKELWDTILSGKVWKGDLYNKRRDNSYFWESETIAPVKDLKGEITHFIAVKEDITSLKNIQNLLEESEEHYRKLFHEAPNGYLSLNKEGHILEVNPAWCGLIGYEKEEVTNKWLGNYLTKRSEEIFKSSYQKLIKSGKKINMEMTFLHKDNKEIIVIVNGRVVLNPDGFFKEAHFILSDISERKKYEDALQLAKLKAEESDRLKTAFLANMSHEIRTPMNAILGFSNLLTDPSLSIEEIYEYVNIINQRGNDLLQIISDIIDISRIEAGDVRMTMEKVSINHFLRELHASFHKILEFNDKGHVQLLLEVSELPDEAVIEADPVRLKQVFENLLQNSIKFTKEGHIKIGYKKGNHEIAFYVEDTGIGIDKNKQNIVFDRFRQANDTHTRDFGGTGLGLAISKNIVDLLGGEMTLESDIGKGTTFFFTIPYSNELTDDAIDLMSDDENLYYQLDLSNKKILIVEDVSSNYIFLESVLKRFNASILWAQDGLKAIEAVKKINDIDLILMDIRMPGINGYYATEKIREFNAEIPIIAQTAYALSDDREKSISAGCNDYLSKPINLEELKNVLIKYI